MADWRMAGAYFKSCNCEPGCPCDFMSPPTYHHCEGLLGMKVETGHFDSVSLDGVKWAVAYYWPGPLHEGNGVVKPYFDPSTTSEQLDALGQILTGQAGGVWFEVLASVISEVKQRWVSIKDKQRDPICARLHGQVVPLGQKFTDPGTGKKYDRPGQPHSRCRCGRQYSFGRVRQRAA